MKKHIFSAALASLAFASSSAMAFDGDRSGFMLGFGAGFHSSSADVTASTSDVAFNDGVSESGAALSFKVGGGLNNKIALYFMSSLNLDSGAAHGLTGLGGTYYFRASGSSFYLNGGLGLGTVTFTDSNNDDDDDDEGAAGLAALFGVGFTPVGGLHLDFNIMTVQAEDSTTFNSIDIDYDITTAQFQVGYTWY